MTTWVATLNDGTEVARSSNVIDVENNHYFPPSDVKKDDSWKKSPTQYTCPWKGETQYWTIGDHKDAAWSYETPLEKAKNITSYVAFDKRQAKFSQA